MNAPRTYLRHLAFSVGTRLVMIGLRLTRNVLLARLLGPADRGTFALLNALPDLIAALTCGGLNSALAYQTARQSDTNNQSTGLLLVQILAYGCVPATLLTWAGLSLLPWFAAYLSTPLGPLAWLLLLAVPLTVLKNGLLTLHNADARVGAFNALKLLESLLPLLLFVGLWWLWSNAPLQAALVSWLLGLLAVAALAWRWLAHYRDTRLRWQYDTQKALLHYGARSHPDVLCQQIMLRADYLLIGALLDPTQLGYYAMASTAAELLLIVPEAVTTPLMKRLLQQGRDINQLTPLAMRLTATIMLCACLLMGLIGHVLIVILFGTAFAPAYPALLALLPGVFGLCHASILRLDLLGKGRPGSLSLLMGLGSVFNLLLNLWLIPHWGIVGAALACSAAYLAVTLGMLGLYCRLSGVPWWRTLILLPADIDWLCLQLRGKEHK